MRRTRTLHASTHHTPPRRLHPARRFRLRPPFPRRHRHSHPSCPIPGPPAPERGDAATILPGSLPFRCARSRGHMPGRHHGPTPFAPAPVPAWRRARVATCPRRPMGPPVVAGPGAPGHAPPPPPNAPTCHDGITAPPRRCCSRCRGNSRRELPRHHPNNPVPLGAAGRGPCECRARHRRGMRIAGGMNAERRTAGGMNAAPTPRGAAGRGRPRTARAMRRPGRGTGGVRAGYGRGTGGRGRRSRAAHRPRAARGARGGWNRALSFL